MRNHHRFLALLSALAITARARAEATSTEEHRALMISAQVLRKEGRLLRARELVTTCASAACATDEPAECEDIRAFCGARRDELSAELPRVNASARDDRGALLAGAAFELDGTRVDAKAPLLVDPGSHVLRATWGGRSGEATFVAERTKATAAVVAIDLRELVQRRPIPPLVWILGGAALGAAAVALGTGIWTARTYSELDACKPWCDGSGGLESRLQATAVVTDVAAIVAVGAAIATTIVLLARPTVHETLRIQLDGSAR